MSLRMEVVCSEPFTAEDRVERTVRAIGEILPYVLAKYGVGENRASEVRASEIRASEVRASTTKFSSRSDTESQRKADLARRFRTA